MKFIEDILVCLWALFVYPVLYVLVEYQVQRMTRRAAA